MSPFVVLSLALAVAAVAVTVVMARELLRNVRKLNAAIRATNERLVPLTEELQSELAVTTTEMEVLTRDIEQAGEERRRQVRRRDQRRKSRARGRKADVHSE